MSRSEGKEEKKILPSPSPRRSQTNIRDFPSGYVTTGSLAAGSDMQQYIRTLPVPIFPEETPQLRNAPAATGAGVARYAWPPKFKPASFDTSGTYLQFSPRKLEGVPFSRSPLHLPGGPKRPSEAKKIEASRLRKLQPISGQGSFRLPQSQLPTEIPEAEEEEFSRGVASRPMATPKRRLTYPMIVYRPIAPGRFNKQILFYGTPGILQLTGYIPESKQYVSFDERTSFNQLSENPVLFDDNGKKIKLTKQDVADMQPNSFLLDIRGFKPELYRKFLDNRMSGVSRPSVFEKSQENRLESFLENYDTAIEEE
jgi:hypothetical protein